MPRFVTERAVAKRLALSGAGGTSASQRRYGRRYRGRSGAGYGFGMGDSITTPTLKDPIDQVIANTQAILIQQKREADARKIALLIAGASALFAAARLGIVAFPLIRRKPA